MRFTAPSALSPCGREAPTNWPMNSAASPPHLSSWYVNDKNHRLEALGRRAKPRAKVSCIRMHHSIFPLRFIDLTRRNKSSQREKLRTPGQYRSQCSDADGRG